MTAAVAALLLATAAGLALARHLDRSATGLLLAGEGILLGIGTTAAILFAFSLASLPWTRSAVVAAVIVIGVIAIFVPSPRARGKLHVSFFDIITLVALVGYTRLATMAPLWEGDYITDFGLKARRFWEARGIDWPLLQTVLSSDTHPDYPPLLPLSFDVLALARGAWNDAAHGLLNVAFALALLLVVRQLAFEETESANAAAFLTAAMVPLAAVPWIGMAEAPMVAFGTAAVLLLRSANDARVPMAAVLLGLAASTKNEGVALIVAVAIALAIAGRARTIPRLWPAVVIPLPWTVARLAHGLRNDLIEGGIAARVAAHLRDPRPLLDALAGYSLGKPLLWIGLAVAFVILTLSVARRKDLELRRSPSFAVSVVVLQFAFYVAAYLASPHDLQWHVKWSWERLVAHLTPTLTYVVLVNLLQVAGRRPPEMPPLDK